MNAVTATIRNGQVELSEPVDWPDGTQVQVVALNEAHTAETWDRQSLDEIRNAFGDEPFERPEQLPVETRESW